MPKVTKLTMSMSFKSDNSALSSDIISQLLDFVAHSKRLVPNVLS
jgi:hypothetical protein